MSAQPFGRALTISREDRVDDPLVLPERICQAGLHPQLQSPEGAQLALHFAHLLDEIPIAARVVDGEMKVLIEPEVGVSVANAAARFVGRADLLLLKGRGPA